MRVSDSMRMDVMARGMADLQERVMVSARQAATGQRIVDPSTDPTDAAHVMRLEGLRQENGAYRSTIRTVLGDLELSEAVLAEGADVLARANELALQGASGNLAATDRAAIATEVARLKEQLVTLANQKGTLGYLFAGTQSNTQPFDSNGAYQTTTAQPRTALIARDQVAAVTVSGETAFTAAGGRDVFADFDSLITALQTNDVAGVRASIDVMDAGRRQVLQARTDAGLLVSRLQSADAAHGMSEIGYSEQASRVLDADPVATFSQFTTLQGNLEQAIQVTRSVLNTLSSMRFGG